MLGFNFELGLTYVIEEHRHQSRPSDHQRHTLAASLASSSNDDKPQFSLYQTVNHVSNRPYNNSEENLAELPKYMPSTTTAAILFEEII